MNVVVLLDLENVHPPMDEFVEFARSEARLAIFHGSHQTRFEAGMVKVLQPLGKRVEWVQCSRNGKNALDFVIAYHLGQLSARSANGEPTAVGPTRYVIVSGDGDFDSLIEYANSNGLSVSRVASLSSAVVDPAHAPPARAKKASKPKSSPVAPESAPKAVKASAKAKTATASANDLYKKIVENLRTHSKNRPSNRAKLEKHLATMIGKATSLTPAKTITRLAHDKHLALAEDKVTYHFE